MFVSFRNLMQPEDQLQYEQSQQQEEHSNDGLKNASPRPGMLRRRNSLTSLVLNTGPSDISADYRDQITTERLSSETISSAVPQPRPGMMRRRNSLTSLVMGVGNSLALEAENDLPQSGPTPVSTGGAPPRSGMLKRRNSLTSLVISSGKNFEADSTTQNRPSSTNIASAMMMKIQSTNSNSTSLKNMLTKHTNRSEVDKQQWIEDVQKLLDQEDPTTENNDQQNDDSAQELRNKIQATNDTIEMLESKKLSHKIVWLRNQIDSALNTVQTVKELKGAESSIQQDIKTVEDKMDVLRQKIASRKAASKVTTFQHILEKNRTNAKIRESKKRQHQLKIMSKLRSRYGSELKSDVKEILFDTDPLSSTPQDNKEYLCTVLEKANKICQSFATEVDTAKELTPIPPNAIASLESTNQILDNMVKEKKEDFDYVLQNPDKFWRDNEIEHLKVLHRENEKRLSELRKEISNIPRTANTLVNLAMQSSEAARRQLPRLVRTNQLRDRQVQLLGKAISTYSDREKQLTETINSFKAISITRAA